MGWRTRTIKRFLTTRVHVWRKKSIFGGEGRLSADPREISCQFWGRQLLAGPSAIDSRKCERDCLELNIYVHRHDIVTYPYAVKYSCAHYRRTPSLVLVSSGNKHCSLRDASEVLAPRACCTSTPRASAEVWHGSGVLESQLP